MRHGRDPGGAGPHPDCIGPFAEDHTLLGPVHAVGRGGQRDVVPGIATIGQIVEIIDPVPKKQPRIPHASRSPIARPVEHVLRPGNSLLDDHARIGAVQMQSPAFNARTAHQCSIGKMASHIGRRTRFERPPADRRRSRRLIHTQLSDLRL